MLRRNAENGIPAAIRQLGSKYENGNYGLVASYKKAARLYQRAADLGNVMAMHQLGHAYQEGQGVKLDKKKQTKYYRMAADRGHLQSQFNLGNCFYNGNGLAQDYDEAMRFYKLAAEQGFTNAEYHLGCIYETGDRVTRDFAEAARWYERAAAKGHEQAILAKRELCHRSEGFTLLKARRLHVDPESMSSS